MRSAPYPNAAVEPYLHTLISYLSGHRAIGVFAVFAAAALESIVVVGIFIPGSALIFVAGALIGLGVFDPAWTFAAAVAGATMGDGFNFWLGGRYRDRIRTMPFFRRRAPLLERAEAHFASHGGSSILVGRMVAPLRSIVPVVAGMSAMPGLRFYIFNALSALAWAVAHLLPGALFGASLQLAGAISSRLAVLMLLVAVLVWLLWWSAGLVLQYLPAALARARTRIVAWAHTGATKVHRAALLLLDPQRPESASLLVATLVLLASTWLFLGVLEDVLTRDPLVHFDAALFAALQQLRTAWVDQLMVSITVIGSWSVALPVSAVVALVLACWRRWRSLAYWLTAQGMGLLLVALLKLGVGRTRPSPIYAGIEQYSFPSAHVTSAIVLYGFLGYLVARGQSLKVQVGMSVAVASLVLLVGLSRLYLGAQWFSDVLGGLGLGLTWLVLLCITYAHRLDDERAPVRALAAGSLVAIVTAAGIQLTTGLEGDLARYRPRAESAAVTMGDWLGTGWQHLAPSRTDFSGEVEEPMTVQWAATHEQVRATLLAAGWQTPTPWTLTAALSWLLPDPAIQQLPVLPKFHQDMKQSILLTHAIDTQTRLVIRMWPTGRVFVATDASQPAPLWLGTVTVERLNHPAGAFTVARTDPDFARAVRLLKSSMEDRSGSTQWRVRHDTPVLLVW